MKNLFGKNLLVVILACCVSCSKTDLPFVLRSTDNLTFGYAASSQTFTICTNGNWTVSGEESDWIDVSPASGVGDGETREVVTVTVARNVGDQRTGRLTIQAANDNIYIDVVQAEGRMILGNLSLSKTLIKGEPLEDVSVVVPFNKGIVGEQLDVSVTLSGPGAEGLTASGVTVELNGETGTFEIPITGTPLAEGSLNIAVSVMGTSASLNATVFETDPGSMIYLEQYFDLLVLGGDHVGKAAGLHLVGNWPTIDGKRVLPENPQFAISGTANTDGTGDYFNTMHPSFVADRGLAGWTGMRVYERPGYVKIGTAGSTDGYIATPPLSTIEGTDDVKVTFKVARWSENASADQNAKLVIQVANGGIAEIAGTEIDLTPEWQEMSFIIRDATPETVIAFRAKSVANNRFLLDDVVISRSVE
ncbi:BACON domain-containing protein [Parapedobacter composti]|nr:BACON domain-containing carbohydrate-binding protein [Parapedobacter composti]